MISSHIMSQIHALGALPKAGQGLGEGSRRTSPSRPSPMQSTEMLRWRHSRAKGHRHETFVQYFNRNEEEVEALDKKMVGAQFGAMSHQLQRRWSSTGVPAPLNVSQEQAEDLEAISKTFVTPASELGLQAPALEEAFFRFACGELTLMRMSDLELVRRGEERIAPGVQMEHAQTACQPDSTLYFLFAELADACVKAGIDREFWQPLLPALVLTQKHFHRTYFDPTCAIRWGAGAFGRWPREPLPLAPFRSELEAFKRRSPPGTPAFESVWHRSVRASLRKPQM